jgi:hypothetical protein
MRRKPLPAEFQQWLNLMPPHFDNFTAHQRNDIKTLQSVKTKQLLEALVRAGLVKRDRITLDQMTAEEYERYLRTGKALYWYSKRHKADPPSDGGQARQSTESKAAQF